MLTDRVATYRGKNKLLARKEKKVMKEYLKKLIKHLHACHLFLRGRVKIARGQLHEGSNLHKDVFARRKICTKGQFCTSNKFARRVKFARL